MLPIADATGRDLVWIEQGKRGWPNSSGLGPEHELRLGDDVVARLRFDNGWPSEAHADGQHWTFEPLKQELHLRHLWSGDPIAVRDEDSRDIAFFFRHWQDIILEFREGNQLRLGRWEWQRSLRLEWIWEDETQEFMHFEERSDALTFHIPPATVEFHQSPLLVVIGWYRILRHWESERCAGY